jgi:S-adenosylmethionine synthetase
MTNRTSLNQHSKNIRDQGAWAPWVADVNEEIYQNIEQVENQIVNQQSQVSDIINSQLPAKQNVLNDHEQRLQSGANQINQILNSELPAKQNVLNDHENRLQGQQNAINNINSDLSNKQNLN